MKAVEQARQKVIDWIPDYRRQAVTDVDALIEAVRKEGAAAARKKATAHAREVRELNDTIERQHRTATHHQFQVRDWEALVLKERAGRDAAEAELREARKMMTDRASLEKHLMLIQSVIKPFVQGEVAAEIARVLPKETR